jgi:hypothetical protein
MHKYDITKLEKFKTEIENYNRKELLKEIRSDKKALKEGRCYDNEFTSSKIKLLELELKKEKNQLIKK